MIKFYFNPKGGKYNFEKPQEFKNLPEALKEKRHIMEIKEYHDRRSNGANAYYWAVVVPYFLEAMGEIKSESARNYIHYDILGQELRQIPDELRPGKTKTEQTSKMDGSQFWKYINKCGVLYYLWFNGSFPPPKSLGYDESKV